MRREKCRWSKAVSTLCSPSNATSKAIVGPNSLVGELFAPQSDQKRDAPGDIMFIRPADSHAFQALGDAPFRIINIMFRPDTVAHPGTRYADEFQDRFFWHVGSSPDAHQIRDPRMERAINSTLELQGSVRTPARIEEFPLNLMTRVADYDAALPNDAPKWLAAACGAARSLSVFRKGATGSVQAAGCGHKHARRESRSHLGLSPSEIVNRIRKEYAAMCLGGSDAPVEEIANGCGIENLSYFYKLSKSHYGTIPRGCRKRHHFDPVQPR